jgi:hypothetical protein
MKIVVLLKIFFAKIAILFMDYQGCRTVVTVELPALCQVSGSKA